MTTTQARQDHSEVAGCAESLGNAKERAWALAAGTSPDRTLFDPELVFHGPAPDGDLKGREAFETALLEPVRAAMPRAAKRPFLHFGGKVMGHVWIAATGNIEGGMTLPLFGVPPAMGSRKRRFGEFCRFEGDRIAGIRYLLDVPGLAQQAALRCPRPSPGVRTFPEGRPLKSAS